MRASRLSHSPNGLRGAALGLLLGLAILGAAGAPIALPGCGGSPRHDAARAAASDSSAAGDSLGRARADSAAAARRGKGGFLGGLLHRGDDKRRDEDERVPVELASTELGDIPAYLSATATLEPEKRALILAKIEGELREVRVEEGAWVRAGQLLALIDDAAPRVAVEEAGAMLRAVELDRERVTALHEQQLASDKDFHDVESRYAQAAAQHKGAQLRFDYTRVTAPFTGRITERFAGPGQTVAAGTQLFSIVDPDSLWAQIYLPEREALRLSPAQEVLITPDTDPTRRLPARVLRIAPTVDTRTGTVKVTCLLTGYGDAVRPGSFVRVRVATDLHRGVPVIPKRALVPEGTDTYVFKAVADSVVKARIEVGYANDERVEVVSGLQVGERIVSVGHGALKTGSRIREVARVSAEIARADSQLQP